MKSRTALLAAAKLVSLGFPVLWLQSPARSSKWTPKGEVAIPPERRGKSPVQEGWASVDALTFEDLAHQLGDGEPGYNIGIRTGTVPGASTCVVVIDLDSPEAILWARAELPETLIVVRTRSGEHWYYRAPAGRVGNRVKILVGGDPECAHQLDESRHCALCGARKVDIDVKGDGGLVVGPASVHGTGVTYRASVPWTPERVAAMPVFDRSWFGGGEWEGADEPEETEDRRPPVHVDGQSRRRRAAAYLESCPGTVSGQGTASADCMYYARALVRGLCVPPEEAASMMARSEWNRRCADSRGDPYPWTRDELLHKCRDAFRLSFDKPYGWLLMEAAGEGPPEPAGKGADALQAAVEEAADLEQLSASWDFDVPEQEPPGDAPLTWPLTDTGNAERLAQRFGESIRWVEDRQVWYVWDEQTGRWVCRQVAMDRCSKVVARRILDEVPAAEERVAAAEDALAGTPPPAEGERPSPERALAEGALDRARRSLAALRSWQKASEHAGRRKAMVQMSTSEPTVAVRSEAFDRHPFLLNVQNGVLDLRDEEPALRPHDRDLYLTKSALTRWDDAAECPVWESCVETWTAGDRDLADFLRRLAGYSLTGSVEEECLFIMVGGGQNGKSTFVNALQAVMGPYSTTAPAGLLMETRQDKATPSQQAGLASLVGMRLVVASESEDSAQLSEGQVKATTCRDKISAKRMYEAPFDFRPTHKVVLTTQHRPNIAGTDDGIWRRVHLVEWLTRVPDDRRDNRLAEKLLAERPGILRWAARGCGEWIRGGLRPPQVVRDALRSYREQQDTVGAFVSDTLDLMAGQVLTKGEMRQAYEAWCEQEGVRAYGAKRFAQELMSRGIRDERTAEARIWMGARFRRPEGASRRG